MAADVLAKAKPPAFQFYASDFLAGTNLLSAAAVGAYTRMLCQSWENGPIPDTPTALYKAMGLCPSDPPFESLWSEILGKWKLTKTGWINPRLEKVREQQKMYREHQASAGVASGKKRRELSRERNVNRSSTEPRTEREPEGQPDPQPNLNSLSLTPTLTPISDLQSPPPTPEIKSAERAPANVVVLDRDGRAVTESGAWNPNPRSIQHSEFIDGADARTHANLHAWCGRVCVTRGLHLDFVKRLVGENRDARLKAWYPTVIAKYEGQEIGENLWDFWNNNFTAWIGTVTTKPEPARATRGQRIVSAFDQAHDALERRKG